MNNILLNKNFKNTAIILIIAIFFISDRFLKYLALNQGGPKALFGQVFLFNFTKNYNISFSLPFHGPILNILLIIIILVLILIIYRLILKEKFFNLKTALLTFILFGAISNITDRLLYGFVIDYLELRYFTVFNLADVMISVGVIILIFKLLKSDKYAQ